MIRGEDQKLLLSFLLLMWTNHSGDATHLCNKGNDQKKVRKDKVNSTLLLFATSYARGKAKATCSNVFEGIYSEYTAS